MSVGIFCLWSISIFIYHGSSHRRCSVKNVFLKILLNWQEYTCARVPFLIKLQAYFIKKRLFSCEFCEIFKNTFFTEHPRATDFDATLKKKFKSLLYVSNEIVNISTGTVWISLRFLSNGCRCVVKAYSGQQKYFPIHKVFLTDVSSVLRYI